MENQTAALSATGIKLRGIKLGEIGLVVRKKKVAVGGARVDARRTQGDRILSRYFFLFQIDGIHRSYGRAVIL